MCGRSAARAARPLPGNAAHGAALYESDRLRLVPHRRAAAAATLGPELTSIGALRGPAHLRDVAHQPGSRASAGISRRARRPTNAGAEIRGIRVNEDVFWIHIRDAGGTVHSLREVRR